jgi:formylglycine-generating enzyme required for sulfatase activity/tRNA A-37 threonylcarbamoyl transferase component Bud32
MQPEFLGDYKILKQMGGGPLGRVYLAEHRFIKKQYVLKVLPKELTEERSFMAQFEEDIARIAQLEHPHIVKVHNVSFHEGVYFLVTDCVVDSIGETTNLAQYMSGRKERLKEEELFHVAQQLADVIETIHKRGLIHGALNLNNILIGEGNPGIQIFVSDLGLYKLLNPASLLAKNFLVMADTFDLYPKEATRTIEERYRPVPMDSEKAGKLAQAFLQGFQFLSPEQKRCEPLTHKADLYAYGVVLYYLIAGCYPEGIFDLPSVAAPEYIYDWDRLLKVVLHRNLDKRPDMISPLLGHKKMATITVETQQRTMSEELAKESAKPQNVLSKPERAFAPKAVEEDPLPSIEEMENMIKPLSAHAVYANPEAAQKEEKRELVAVVQQACETTFEQPEMARAEVPVYQAAKANVVQSLETLNPKSASAFEQQPMPKAEVPVYQSAQTTSSSTFRQHSMARAEVPVYMSEKPTSFEQPSMPYAQVPTYQSAPKFQTVEPVAPSAPEIPIFQEAPRTTATFQPPIKQPEPTPYQPTAKPQPTAFRPVIHREEVEPSPELATISQEKVVVQKRDFAEATPKPMTPSQDDYSKVLNSMLKRDPVVKEYHPEPHLCSSVDPIPTEMVVIPGGEFMRGANDGNRDEGPAHKVRVESYALDLHPVTNEQFVRYLQFMGGEKDQQYHDIIRLKESRINRSAGKLSIESGYAKHPVVGVTWYGAVGYARWVGKRLPLEAEWEIAALGGLEGLPYPSGNNIEKTQANFFSSDTTAVMSYAPNGYGIYDLAGNVYEWCQDWYGYNYYETSALEPDQPKGPLQGVYRVLRGGCWKSSKEDMRCSHRHRNNPGTMNGTYGFRCAADVQAI